MPISIEALGRQVAVEKTALGEALIEVSELFLPLLNGTQGIRGQAPEAIVDPAHLGCRPSLVVCQHATVLVVRVGDIPATLVAEHGHHRRQRSLARHARATAA